MSFYFIPSGFHSVFKVLLQSFYTFGVFIIVKYDQNKAEGLK